MEIEGLFSSGKWNLIELLAQEELSPLQLSEKIGTSVANVSQQLKLLELVGLVQTRKLPNRERGKPRTLYSIAQDNIMVICALKNFAKKHFFKAAPVVSAVSRILCFPQQELHYPLLKLFWIIEPQLEGVSAIVYDTPSMTVLVATPKPSSLKFQGVYALKGVTFHVKVVSDFRAKPLKPGQYPIYDPEHSLVEAKQ